MKKSLAFAEETILNTFIAKALRVCENCILESPRYRDRLAPVIPINLELYQAAI